MTYNEFVSKYTGKALDYDGVAGVQCVDLIKFYLRDVFSISAGAWGDAHAYYDNYDNLPLLKADFVRIPNTPDLVPQKGDIVVWSGSLNGGWGHIAIATGQGNRIWFDSYDQNWFGRHDPCTLIKHSYKYVLGVLRPKDSNKLSGIKVKPIPVLDKSGYKIGDNTIGSLALKELLLVAHKLGLTKYKVNKDGVVGKGTQLAVNELLQKWGYKHNGIAGVNFIKRLHTEIEKHCK